MKLQSTILLAHRADEKSWIISAGKETDVLHSALSPLTSVWGSLKALHYVTKLKISLGERVNLGMILQCFQNKMHDVIGM